MPPASSTIRQNSFLTIRAVKVRIISLTVSSSPLNSEKKKPCSEFPQKPITVINKCVQNNKTWVWSNVRIIIYRKQRTWAWILLQCHSIHPKCNFKSPRPTGNYHAMKAYDTHGDGTTSCILDFIARFRWFNTRAKYSTVMFSCTHEVLMEYYETNKKVKN